MRRRKWGPIELVDDNGFSGPIRAGYLDQGLYWAKCQCRQDLCFDHRLPVVVCEGCNRKYEVRPAKVG